MTLHDLRPGQRATITEINAPSPALMSRMAALGLVPGEHVEVLRRAPLGDPMQIRAGNTLISVRRNDSLFIAIEASSAV